MKNTNTAKNKVSLILTAFVSLFLFGATAFAQSDAKQNLINVTVVEIKSRANSGFDSLSSLPANFPRKLSSEADFKRNYLDKGKLINKFALVSANDSTSEFSSGNQIPVIQRVNGKEVLEFINAGLSLKTTSQSIYDENGAIKAINLAVELADNEVDPSVKSDEIPAVRKREFKSSVTLKYGETAILGDYYENGVKRYYAISLGMAGQ